MYKLSDSEKQLVDKYKHDLVGIYDESHILMCAKFIDNTIKLNEGISDKIPNVVTYIRNFYDNLMLSCGPFVGIQVPTIEEWKKSDDGSSDTARAQRLVFIEETNDEFALVLKQPYIQFQDHVLKSRYSIGVDDLETMEVLEKGIFEILMFSASQDIVQEVIETIYNVSEKTSWEIGNGSAPEGLERLYKIEKYRTLLTTLIQESCKIARSTRRGAGNVILANPIVTEIIASLDDFKKDPIVDHNPVIKVGTINGIAVYRTNYYKEDKVTILYNGTKSIDSGIVLLLGALIFDFTSNKTVLGLKYAIDSSGANDYIKTVEVSL